MKLNVVDERNGKRKLCMLTTCFKRYLVWMHGLTRKGGIRYQYAKQNLKVALIDSQDDMACRYIRLETALV